MARGVFDDLRTSALFLHNRYHEQPVLQNAFCTAQPAARSQPLGAVHFAKSGLLDTGSTMRVSTSDATNSIITNRWIRYICKPPAFERSRKHAKVGAVWAVIGCRPPRHCGGALPSLARSRAEQTLAHSLRQ
jgi:hypothetical protein